MKYRYVGDKYMHFMTANTELDDAKIDARMRRIRVHRATQNYGASLTPLRKGVVSPWESLLKLILI
jgi:adenylate cyclase